MIRTVLAAGIVVGMTASAMAQHAIAPDQSLTPGAIATHDKALICDRDAQGRTYSETHRVWRDQRDTMRKYNISPAKRQNYTDDDRVPVCLGGDNASPKNHWAEPWRDAERKDRIEDLMCRDVCDGRISLDAAQRYFLSGEWEQK